MQSESVRNGLAMVELVGIDISYTLQVWTLCCFKCGNVWRRTTPSTGKDRTLAITCPVLHESLVVQTSFGICFFQNGVTVNFETEKN
jgi:hypothetical protein